MASESTATINVEIWSDVVCPWCYIGKRRFERAAEALAGELAFDVTYRPYQLDPGAAAGRTEPVVEAYARKFGGPDQARVMIERVTSVAAEEGIEFHMDRSLRANTRLAHRLLWLAEQPGSGVDQAALKERLLQAYFVDGLDIGVVAVLANCVADVGGDAEQAAALLTGDAGVDEVEADLALAAELGITAVPTFVINGQWAIPGAQDTETFVGILRRVGERLAAAAPSTAEACADDACDV